MPKKKKIDNSPEARTKRRRNLWVVEAGRMKQYGDTVIESPGQVIRRNYMRNDQKLLDIGYVRPVEESEDFKKCKTCGRMFLGSSTAGPYRNHLQRARHDQAKQDLDVGTTGKDGRKPRDAQGDPDGAGDWDIEPEGAPPPTKVSDEKQVIEIGKRR